MIRATINRESLKEAGIRVGDFGVFWNFVEELGGDPRSFLREMLAEASAGDLDDMVIPYRVTVDLMERAAERFARPSFGLELAAKPGGLKIFGPLQVAMRNARTMGETLRYHVDYVQTYCPVFRSSIGRDDTSSRILINFEVVTTDGAYKAQGIENCLLLMHEMVAMISNGGVKPAEVWFRHANLSPIETYRRHFGDHVFFGRPINAIFIDLRDFEAPIPDQNDQLFELAHYFIEREFRPSSHLIGSKVREIVREKLAWGNCTPLTVAAELGMLVRTLQRRLRDEDTSFEAIKDDVRRELALHYLGQQKSLSEVAELLGYSEPSVLTRSCYRWFATSPRKMRMQMRMTS